MAKKASKKATPKKVAKKAEFAPSKCHNCDCTDIKCTGRYAIGCECCR